MCSAVLKAETRLFSFRKTERIVFSPLQQQKIRLLVGKEQIMGRIYDLSPFGVGVITESDHGDKLNIGNEILVLFEKSKASEAIKGIIAHVSSYSSSANEIIFGVSFLEHCETPAQAAEKRIGGRIPCSEYFAPICWARSPQIFREKMYFRAKNISATGMQLVTSARNKGLHIGQELTFNMVLPTIGNYEVKAIIKYICISLKGDRYTLGIQFREAKTEFQLALCQFLLETNGDLSCEDLLAMNFKVGKLGDALKVEYPQNGEDFNKILEIRRQSYTTTVLKSIDKIKREDCIDDLDVHSLHLIFKSHQHVIAAARILILDSELKHSEVAKKCADLPAGIRNSRSLEISRVAILPHWQGKSDVFLNILQIILHHAENLDAKYLIICCYKELLQMYQRLGFKSLGASYETTLLGQPVVLFPLYLSIGEEDIAHLFANNPLAKKVKSLD